MEKKTKDKFFCDICHQEVKSRAGIENHKRLVHHEGVVKSYPDEIGKRLSNLESLAVASAKADNPGSPVEHTEASLIIALKALLPDMQKFNLVVLSFGSRYDDDYMEFKRFRIIKDPDFSQAGFGGLVVGTGAQEL